MTTRHFVLPETQLVRLMGDKASATVSPDMPFTAAQWRRAKLTRLGNGRYRAEVAEKPYWLSHTRKHHTMVASIGNQRFRVSTSPIVTGPLDTALSLAGITPAEEAI